MVRRVPPQSPMLEPATNRHPSPERQADVERADQVLFSPAAEEFERFESMLDGPAATDAGLRRLMDAPAPLGLGHRQGAPPSSGQQPVIGVPAGPSSSAAPNPANFPFPGLAQKAQPAGKPCLTRLSAFFGQQLINTPGERKRHPWVALFPLHRKGSRFRRRKLMLQMGSPELHHLPPLGKLSTMVVCASHFATDMRQLEFDVI